MNIVFDIDGVLTDYEGFMNAYGGRYLSRHGQNGTVQNPEAYSFRERFRCSHKMEVRFFARYLFWYAKKMPIRENATMVIKKLQEEGYDIHFITARVLADKQNLLGSLMRLHLRRWLKKNGVRYNSISYVSLKHCSEEKLELCKKLKADILVEDDPENIEKLCGVCRVLCMDASYNQNLRDVEHVVDFGELYQCIQGRQMQKMVSRKIPELEMEKRVKYLCCLKKYYEELPFDYSYKKKYDRFIVRSVKRYLWLLKWLFSIQIEGKQDLRASDSVIYVCNHRSSLDIFLCYYILGNIPARFLGKKEYEMKWYSFLQRRAGTVFVERGNAWSRKASKNLMIQELLNGGNVLLYPEGTRNKTEQVMLPFQRGAVNMAQITGCPIVPIVIRKTGKRIRVCIEEAVYVRKEDDTGEKNDFIRDKMCRVYERRGEENLGKGNQG